MTETNPDTCATQRLQVANRIAANTRRVDILNVKEPNLEDALRRTQNYVDQLTDRLRRVREERDQLVCQLKRENEWLRARNAELANNRNRLKEQQL